MHEEHLTEASDSHPNLQKGDECPPNCLEEKAVGKRYLEKAVCNECLGDGVQINKSDCSCMVCSGSGWLFDSNEEPYICQQCEGFKVVTIKTEKTCDICSGRGFLIKLLQQYECRIECANCNQGRVACDCTLTGNSVYECDNCNGDGIIKCNECNGSGNPQLLPCPFCDSDGQVAPYQCSKCHGNCKCRECADKSSCNEYVRKWRYSQWIDSDLCITLSNIYGKNFWHNMDTNEKIVVDNDKYLSSIRCPSCHGSGCHECDYNKVIGMLLEKPCGTCGGSGKCNHCSGRGHLTICLNCDGDTTYYHHCCDNGNTECDVCEGTGASMCDNCLTEDDSAGTIPCPDCFGLGSKTIIISRDCTHS